MNMRIAISLALIVAVAVRIVLVLTTGYHLDEEWHYLTARMIDAPLFERELRSHAHPVLYFLLLKGLLSIHDALISLCLLYTSPSPRDKRQSRMPSSA